MATERIGDLLTAQKYYYSNKNNISKKDIEYSFYYACEYGYLDAAKWLLLLQPSINSIENIDKIEACFYKACFNYQIKITEWLLLVQPKIRIIDKVSKYITK
jgi:hypothetical protein